MKLEIRNLQSQATYEIDPEGAVLGREGSKADIVLRDQAVSKKHAKIYEKNGRWYLEDLASSNGTFVDNRRITEPVILSPGAVFALSENQFEVVQIINGANGKAAFDRGEDSRDQPYQDNVDDLPPLGMMPGDDSQDGKRSSRSMPKNQSARLASPAQAGADPADDIPPPGADQKGIGYFFIAVPKAIAFYLAAIPLMAVNPVGTIKKHINEQKFAPMGPMQLIAYALPANLFINLLGVIVAVIVSIVAGAFLLPIVPLITAIIVAVVASVITGFIWHPLLRWIINFLKGESDEKSRTNYFITVYTAAALTAIPSALVTLMGLIPLPFVSIVPVLITLVASLITWYAAYAWFKHFNVVGWFQKVLMVFGVLILLGAGYNLVMSILAGISAFTSGSSGAVAAAGAAGTDGLTAEQKEAMAKGQELAAKMAAAANDPEALKKLQEEQAKLMAAQGADPEALKKATEAAQKQAEELAKAGNSAGAQLTKEQQEAVKKAQEEMEAAKAAAEKGGKEAAAAAKAAEDAATKKEKEAAAKAEKEAAAAAAKAEKEAAAAQKKQKEEEAEEEEESASAVAAGSRMAAPKMVAGQTQFEEFVAKRTAVEAAFEKDPSLIKKPELRDLYEKYWRKTGEIRTKWGKKKAKDLGGQKVNDRYKDLEVYEATGKMVQQMYQKIYQ